ncbi:uncharacterized protein LOC133319824 [Danaus plexippus]|uniref:uncharacterized protein LOC133319824 n=1 Tax=Danaus plexippus TaxID=13037 RepID=UPI002AB01652|nr:uncharacterized protein LOC133319824 [Danaus plexippus]
MNLEEMYTVLRGASRGQGVEFDVVMKWFEACSIIDGRFITQELFVHSYERLAPNREHLTMVKFIQLVGILSRESRRDIRVLLNRFESVKPVIISEIQEMRRTWNNEI